MFKCTNLSRSMPVVRLHVFFTSALDEVTGKLHALSAISPGKKTQQPVNKSPGGAHSRSERLEKRKMFELQKFEPRVVRLQLKIVQTA